MMGTFLSHCRESKVFIILTGQEVSFKLIQIQNKEYVPKIKKMFKSKKCLKLELKRKSICNPPMNWTSITFEAVLQQM